MREVFSLRKSGGKKISADNSKLEDLVGADKMSNARITLSILNGEKGHQT